MTLHSAECGVFFGWELTESCISSLDKRVDDWEKGEVERPSKAEKKLERLFLSGVSESKSDIFSPSLQKGDLLVSKKRKKKCEEIKTDEEEISPQRFQQICDFLDYDRDIDHKFQDVLCKVFREMNYSSENLTNTSEFEPQNIALKFIVARCSGADLEHRQYRCFVALKSHLISLFYAECQNSLFVLNNSDIPPVAIYVLRKTIRDLKLETTLPDPTWMVSFTTSYFPLA